MNTYINVYLNLFYDFLLNQPYRRNWEPLQWQNLLPGVIIDSPVVAHTGESDSPVKDTTGEFFQNVSVWMFLFKKIVFPKIFNFVCDSPV